MSRNQRRTAHAALDDISRAAASLRADKAKLADAVEAMAASLGAGLKAAQAFSALLEAESRARLSGDPAGADAAHRLASETAETVIRMLADLEVTVRDGATRIRN